MSNVYLPDAAYADLIENLAGAFMRAATSTADLNSELAEALAVAGVMPETTRADEIEITVEGKAAALIDAFDALPGRSLDASTHASVASIRAMAEKMPGPARKIADQP